MLKSVGSSRILPGGGSGSWRSESKTDLAAMVKIGTIDSCRMLRVSVDVHSDLGPDVMLNIVSIC